jgi:hypothetical protein
VLQVCSVAYLQGYVATRDVVHAVFGVRRTDELGSGG